MSSPVKMKIFAFEKDDYSGEYFSEFEMQVNPNNIKFGKTIQQNTSSTPGTGSPNKKYAKHKETTFSFDVLLDATGVISIINIKDEVKKLEDTVYKLNSGTHEPNYVLISWGDFIYKGVLTSLNYDYTLFSPEGQPLRVKASLTFDGHMSLEEAAVVENKQSPDLSRLITLKAGESLPYWCGKIYGDASYCTDVARYNHLTGFRHIEPGTKIMFPPLVRVK